MIIYFPKSGLILYFSALANGKSLDDTAKVIAVGAGTCSNLLNNVNADFIITGEISHHEIMHESIFFLVF